VIASTATRAWWRPDPPPAPPVAAATAGSRFAFAALIAFTAILIVSPQVWFPQLGAIRIALLAALLAIASNLLHRAWSARTLPAHPAVAIAFAMVGWAVLTAPLSLWPGGSVSMLFEHFAKAVAFFWLIATLVTTEARLRIFLWVLMASAVPLALDALQSYRAGEFIEGSAAAAQRIAGYGGSGLATNPNDMALTLNLLIPVAAVLALVERTWLRRASAALVLVACVAGVVVTFSRAGFLSLAGMALFAAAASAWRRPLVTIAAVLVVVLSMPLLPEAYRARIGTITDISADPTGSAQGRWDDVKTAARLAALHPIIGVGLGQNVLALNRERGTTWREVHNVYLQLALDLGVPGLVLFLALFGVLVRTASRVRRRARRVREGRQLGTLARGAQAALLAFAIAALFHPVAYQFYFFVVAGFVVALDNVWRTLAARQAEPDAS
jgi:putative inorganic carbon (HCO3(-)) transporter